MQRLALILLAVLAWGCPIKRDHGFGECIEYKPMCVTGPARCETDKRGCEICTCDEGLRPARPSP